MYLAQFHAFSIRALGITSHDLIYVPRHVGGVQFAKIDGPMKVAGHHRGDDGYVYVHGDILSEHVVYPFTFRLPERTEVNVLGVYIDHPEDYVCYECSVDRKCEVAYDPYCRGAHGECLWSK